MTIWTILRFDMGCVASLKKVHVTNVKGSETVLAALVRLEEEIIMREKSHPVQRLAVVSAEMISIKEEMNIIEGTTLHKKMNSEEYAKTMHDVLNGLDIYRCPMLAFENEDFIAKLNRKEMHRIESTFLSTRYNELRKEKSDLRAQILRIRYLYRTLQKLHDSLWRDNSKLVTLEDSVRRANSMCNALASVSIRLTAAVTYAQAAARAMDEALPTWKLASLGKNGWDRTIACADACTLLVKARCLERASRRVLSAYAAPRASRTLRLALDYAFTDIFNDQKYEQTTDTFKEFKEALSLVINCIYQVLSNNMENLSVAEKDLSKARTDLRTARVNDTVKKGFADLIYEPRLLHHMHLNNK